MSVHLTRYEWHTLPSMLYRSDLSCACVQMKFHSAFERSTARVIYRDDWGTQRPAIMKKNGWAACSSEVLISTPRRFGKTFS